MHNIQEHLKDVTVDFENKGDKLVVTLSGDAEKLEMLERKLKALHELYSSDVCNCSCGNGGMSGCC